MDAQSPRRRDDEQRAAAILDAALAQLRERGHSGASMLGVATAARTSKEVVYRLFGDREGLFTALVRRQADRMNTALGEVLSDPAAPPDVVLRRFGRELLDVFFGEASIAINRAAAADAARSPVLGRALRAGGRAGTGALIVRYLRRQADAGVLEFPSAEEAFEIFLGLLLRDRQVGVLTGARAVPTPAEMDVLADRAVALFDRLFGHAPGV